MTKDGALIHAMKMGVRRRDGLADAMNMAWTCARRSRDGPARLIPGGTNDIPKEVFYEDLGSCRAAARRYRPERRCAIRSDAAGADDLPKRREQILRQTYRQAATDECLPAREQVEAFGRLPQGRGVARRVSGRRPAQISRVLRQTIAVDAPVIDRARRRGRT